MTAQRAEPLPECQGCETPTRRDTWTSTGGYCSVCVAALRRAAAQQSVGLIPLFEEA